MTEPLLTKCCTKCGEWKDRSQFYKDAQKRDGTRPECKVCEAKRTKAYSSRADVRERRREYNREYYHRPEANERRRVRRHAPEKLIEKREMTQAWMATPRGAAMARKRRALGRLRAKIAVETCKRLGIDLTKLAQEQYDAEQNA